MVQQYYGMTPWGMYPANMLQQQQGGPQGSVSQQQQQQLLQNNAGRPMTPQQTGPNDGLGGPGAGNLPQNVQPPGSYLRG